MKRTTRLMVFLSAAILLGACQSGSSSPAAPVASPKEKIESIKKVLAKEYPNIDIHGVKPVDVFPGVYEVQIDNEIVYMDETAKYAIMGNLIDLKSRVNLTEKALQKQAAQQWKKLPFQYAIKEVRGEGKREIVLFSDADCPFCRKIEKSLQELDNVTIYTFMAPIAELHPDAARKSRAIWCAEDRLKAWTGYMRDNEPLPELKDDCKAPEEEWTKLQKRFKIRATPTLLFSNGTVVPGALGKEEIEKILDGLEPKDKKKTP